MHAILEVFIPLDFEEAHAYIDAVLSRHGFSLANPFKPTVYAIAHTPDGLGENLELTPDEVKRRFRRDDIRAVQYWCGNADILVVWTLRGNGWDFQISGFVGNKRQFDGVAKELFSDTLEQFAVNVGDEPTVTLIFE